VPHPKKIRALREQQFGAEWQQRLDAYRSARRAIETNSSLSAAARAHAVETLLGERFTPQERLRVDALEAIQQESDR